MPFIPRRQSPTSGVPPELLHAVKQAHAPIPVQSPESKREKSASPETPATRRQKISLGKISPHSYVPDQKQILRTLFGKEPDVDPNTGQLVLNQPAPAANATVGNGGQAPRTNSVGVMFHGMAPANDHGPPA